MNQIKTIVNATINLIAKLLNKAIAFAAPLLDAPKVAKKAGKRASFIDYAKCVVGIAIVVTTMVIFAMVAGTVANFLAAILSIVLSAWLAQIVAAIGLVYFELAVIGAMFDTQTVAA